MAERPKANQYPRQNNLLSNMKTDDWFLAYLSILSLLQRLFSAVKLERKLIVAYPM
jgi:hypothetical protein